MYIYLFIYLFIESTLGACQFHLAHCCIAQESPAQNDVKDSEKKLFMAFFVKDGKVDFI